jgi:hypothetical protein
MGDQLRGVRGLGPSEHLDASKQRVPRVDRFELKTPRKDSLDRTGEARLKGYAHSFPRVLKDGR